MPSCPLCGSKKLWKDGLRYTHNGHTQRYFCRNCGYRFSVSNKKKKSQPKEEFFNLFIESLECQVGDEKRACVSLAETKNLAAEPQKEKWAAGATETSADIRSKLVEFAWWLKKQGYKDTTITSKVKLLKILAKRGADLLNPESVKEVIARQEWSEGRKENAVDAFTSFLVFIGGNWDPPKYKRIDKLPFIPTEEELDALIAGSGKKMAAFLQLLKETGIRAGEAWNLKWTDLDMQSQTIRVTPEKGSEPRILRISAKCLSMIQSLPRKGNLIFGGYPI